MTDTQAQPATQPRVAQPRVAQPRARKRALKTWSAFGNLGRRPTEYEIVTHNLNHTAGSVGLEMGPEVHGNRWLQAHRDAIRLQVPDWDAFRDPDAVTYTSYVCGQDDQETYVEGLFEQYDESGHDTVLTPTALALLSRTLAPSRYLAHGLQMLSAYLQQLAISSYVGNCAAFQTADQLRRVQTVAYRTTQLRLQSEVNGSNAEDRQQWQGAADWQAFRRAVELALVEFDWDRAFVVTNLVVKPVSDLITLRELGRQSAAAGAPLDAQVLENLYRDSRRSQRWTQALVNFLCAADPGNQAVLQEYLDEFAPLGHEMISAGARLISLDGSVPEDDIAARVRTSWSDLVSPLQLPGEN